MEEKNTAENGIVWKDRKRIWCGLPWTFTVYTLTEDRLMIRRGLFTTTEDEVRLYRIRDVGLRRTLLQRIFGLGTILISSTDKSLGDFELLNVRGAENLRGMLSELVETARDKKRVGIREIAGESHGPMPGPHPMDFDHDDDDDDRDFRDL